LLALTLGAGADRPAFLQINLADHSVRYLGYHPALYHALLKSPAGTDSVIAFEDNSGQTGWDLALVDSKGSLVRDLQRRPEDDLQPAWRPDGEEIAFLAEKKPRRGREP